eukprot:gene14110-16225_t
MGEVAECYDKPDRLHGPASIDLCKLPKMVGNYNQNTGDAAILVRAGSETTLHYHMLNISMVCRSSQPTKTENEAVPQWLMLPSARSWIPFHRRSDRGTLGHGGPVTSYEEQWLSRRTVTVETPFRASGFSSSFPARSLSLSPSEPFHHAFLPPSPELDDKKWMF